MTSNASLLANLPHFLSRPGGTIGTKLHDVVELAGAVGAMAEPVEPAAGPTKR